MCPLILVRKEADCNIIVRHILFVGTKTLSTVKKNKPSETAAQAAGQYVPGTNTSQRTRPLRVSFKVGF